MGDNLGSNALGGFKESFFCPSVLPNLHVTNDEYKSISNSSQLELRYNDKHCYECDLLKGLLHDHYSKTYGINRRSALLDVPSQCLMEV